MLSGYSRDELLAMEFYEVLHPDDRDLARERGLARQRGEVLPSRYEVRLRTRNGRDRWVDVSVTVIKLHGAPAVLGTGFDITERKRAEAALRDSETRFRRIVETAGEGIWMLDALNRTAFVNHRVAEMLGCRVEDMLGQPLDAFVAAEGRAVAAANFATRRAGNPHAQEFKFRRKDGSDVWASVITSHVTDKDGQYAGVLAMMSDVTDRRLAEQTLRQYAERLKILRQIDEAIRVAQSPGDIAQAALDRIGVLIPSRRASVALVDFDAKRAVLLAVRASGETRLGAGTRFRLDELWTAEQQETLRLGQARLVEDLERLAPRLPAHETLLAEGVRSILNVPLVCRGNLIGVLNLGSARPEGFGLAHIEIAREVANHLAVAIEDARLYEAERQARQTAESLAAGLRALSNRLVVVQESERRSMARELHDEIGQLLTGLKLTLEVAGRAPADRVRPRLDEATRGVNDLIARVRNLSLALRPAMLDDLGLLPALLWHFDRYTTHTGVKVHFRHDGVGDRFPPEIETAAYRLVQEALTNVARHAQVTEADVQVWMGNGALCVQVRDRGVGFEHHVAFRAPSCCGLRGMQERVVLLGGQLAVDSTPAEGTCVTASLPLRPDAAVHKEIDA